MGKAIFNANFRGVESHSSLKQLVAASATSWTTHYKFVVTFFTRFDIVANESIKNYTQEQKDGNSTLHSVRMDWLERAEATGQLFPSNLIVRPFISFGPGSRKENSESCRQNLQASKSHSPGIFIVQCVCGCPKLISVSGVEECEVTSTALSILLFHFKRLPKVWYYDDSCNLVKSIVLHVPWINKDCIIVSGRFHYRGHNCSAVYDPDSYGITKKPSASGAESINQQ